MARPFLLRPRTWGIIAAGAVLGLFGWLLFMGGCPRRSSDAECREWRSNASRDLSAEEQGERYVAAAIMGAFVGLIGAYMTDPDVGRRRR